MGDYDYVRVRVRVCAFLSCACLSAVWTPVC